MDLADKVKSLVFTMGRCTKHVRLHMTFSDGEDFHGVKKSVEQCVSDVIRPSEGSEEENKQWELRLRSEGNSSVPNTPLYQHNKSMCETYDGAQR